MEGRPTLLWWVALAVSSSLLVLGAVAVTYEIAVGVGTWGLNRTVGWAFGITNFVFWIGIGHAGTLISAILFLFRQRWRTSVNRAAEAMTIFAVLCAGIFPGHPHRPPLVCLLDVPVSQYPRLAVGELPFAAGVGLFRNLDVPHGLGNVLVHRHAT